MINSYVSIDLETTGLNPKKNKITEIGAVKVKDGVITERFETLVNPGVKLDERIVELTKITDEDLKAAPFIEEVFQKLLDFMEDLPILGHSILFDYSFLKKEASYERIPFEKNGIDTLKIAKKYLGDLEHKSLGFLCEHYGIKHNAHRAYEDALATHELYKKLVEEFYDKDDLLFVPTKLLFHVKKDTPASPAQKDRLKKLYKMNNLSFDFDVDRLTKSEASRITDMVLSKYGRPVGK